MMITKGEHEMTDFQFKALMTMVKDILDRSHDLEDAKRAIDKYASGNLNQKPEKQENEREDD